MNSFQGKPIALRAQNCMVEPHINCCNHLVNRKPKFQSPWWKTPMPPALAPAKTTKDDLLGFFVDNWWLWDISPVTKKRTIFISIPRGKGIITTRYTRLWSIPWKHTNMISTCLPCLYLIPSGDTNSFCLTKKNLKRTQVVKVGRDNDRQIYIYIYTCITQVLPSVIKWDVNIYIYHINWWSPYFWTINSHLSIFFDLAVFTEFLYTKPSCWTTTSLHRNSTEIYWSLYFNPLKFSLVVSTPSETLWVKFEKIPE